MQSVIESIIRKHGITEDELLALYRTDLLYVITTSQKLAPLQQELTVKYPDIAPNPQLSGLYHLTFTLMREKITFNALFDQRVFHPWSEGDQRFYTATETARKYIRTTKPDLYAARLEREAAHQRGKFPPQLCPRLIDRLRFLNDDEIQRLIRRISAKLTAHQFEVIRLHYFEHLSQSQIARTSPYTPADISLCHRNALHELAPLLPALQASVFGPGTVGALIPAA